MAEGQFTLPTRIYLTTEQRAVTRADHALMLPRVLAADWDVQRFAREVLRYG